jgi:hypothetical protein
VTDPEGLWIATQPATNGTYAAALEIGQDLSVPLTRDGSVRYALAVLDAAQRAEYDAAIAAQYADGIGADEIQTISTLATLRKIRQPLDHDATAPLTFVPGVDTAREPFIAIHLDGRQIGQFTPADAVEHATYILQGPVAAALDAAYHRWLREVLDLDDTKARAMVGDLHRWRTTDTGTPRGTDTPNGEPQP